MTRDKCNSRDGLQRQVQQYSTRKTNTVVEDLPNAIKTLWRKAIRITYSRTRTAIKASNTTLLGTPHAAVFVCMCAYFRELLYICIRFEVITV